MDDEELVELLNSHASMHPAPGMAGVFYRDAPASAALGGGFGQFLWFGGTRELLEFLRDHAHDLNLGMGPMFMDHRQLRKQASHFLERAIDGDLELTPLITQLNIALEGFVEIEWIGNFEDLVIGDDPFPMGVRKGFRESNGGVSDVSLGNDEVPGFVAFLGEYGI